MSQTYICQKDIKRDNSQIHLSLLVDLYPFNINQSSKSCYITRYAKIKAAHTEQWQTCKEN